MRNLIKTIRQISILKYIRYNYFCSSIVRKNGHHLYPGKNSILCLSKSSKIVLNGDLYLNDRKIGKSRAEAFLVMEENSKLYIQGMVRLRFGTTVQVSRNGCARFGSFSCNAYVNIQCNKNITIGNDCMFGRNVLIFDSDFHPTGTRSDRMKILQENVVIGNHVWLGANSVVLRGSVIGDGAIIGTNACVSGKITASSIVPPTFDHSTSIGLLWARSLQEEDLKCAEKYLYFPNEDIVLLDPAEVAKNGVIILHILKKYMGSVNYEQEQALVDDRIFDSLSLITVVSHLSEYFHCEIPFTEVNSYNFNNIENMAKLITRLTKMKNSPNRNHKLKQLFDKNLMEVLNLKIADTEKSVVERIFEYARICPTDIAIIANEKETNYFELAGMILSINQFLQKRGIHSGDCIAVQALHEDFCIACYYAIHLLGAILVPVENKSSDERILEIIRETKSTGVICSNRICSDIICISYKEVRENAHNILFSSSEIINYPELDCPCEMVFTTGTTGKSKGVVMTHRHISWYAYSVAKSIRMKKGNRFLLTTPLNHAGGIRRTHLSLANGCCMVYIDGMSNIAKYFQYIEDYQVTALYLPPWSIRILLTQTKDKLYEYADQIDFVYVSSSVLPVSDCEELRKLLPSSRLYNAYEASETPGVSVYDFNSSNMLKNCMGKANEGVEIGILTESGEITQMPDIEGQICIKSQMNMKEYYLEPELTAAVWRNGWFISNDLGKMDKEGNIYYNGRKGDVINIGGYKISPTDVEEAALRSKMINECICIEEFDKYGIPYLKLLVVTTDHDFHAAELLQFLTGKLEAYKVPRLVECVDTIKKTFNGKIDRKYYRNLRK